MVACAELSECASAQVTGAETSTLRAPDCSSSEALSLLVKMPVHSAATSTPCQGSLVGSRSAVTLILPVPTSIQSSPEVMVPGKRPWTLSYFSRCALVWMSARSLIATTSISLRPDS
mgnify:CR=1 FL=1